jgi:hypothetical protein
VTEARGLRAQGVSSALTLVSGVSLSIVPPAALSISANTFSIAEQGVVAVAITASTFIGQIIFGAVVESRLGSPGVRRDLAVPSWLVAVAAAAVLAMVIAPSSVLVVALALPALFTVLEVGRGVSVAEGFARREVAAAIALGLGAGVGLIAALTGSSIGFVPLAIGVAAATAIRVIGAPRVMFPPDPSIRRWVLADVTVTGVAFPALNAVTLLLIGPASSAVFAAVATISGLLAIPLNYLRVRLLKEHSTLEIVVTAVALVLAAAAIFIAEALGVFDLFFGKAWALEATIVPLAAACLWRFAALLSALPFAALRRAGHARVVTIVRGCCAVFTIAISLLAALTGSVVLIFAALLVGELVLAAVSELVRRRIAAPKPEAA